MIRNHPSIIHTSLFLWIFLFIISACTPPIQGDIIIKAVNVVDVVNGEILPDQTIIIKGNRIADVKAYSKSDEYKANQVIDGTSKFVIPGMWDMHTHTLYGHFDSSAYHLNLSNKLMIANGVTGFRDMGLVYEEAAEKFRKGLKSGEYLPQRFIYASFMLDGDPPMMSRRPDVFATNDPEKAIEFVDSLMANTQADFLKVYSFLTPEVFRAVSKYCAEHNIDFAGHYPAYLPLNEMVTSGIKSVEHGMELIPAYSSKADSLLEDGHLSYPEYLSMFEDQDDVIAQAFFKKMKENDVWMVPTLVITRGLIRYSSQDSVVKIDERNKYAEWEYWDGPPPSQHERFLKEASIVENRILDAHVAGVQMLGGTDASFDNPFVYDGFSLHEEMELMVQCGLSPAEALKTTTYNPANYLGATDSLGTVSKNKMADLVILAKNPLTDIKNTQSISGVISDGNYLNEADLNRLLNEVEEFLKTKRSK
jgi:hypothetical protein